MSHTCAIPVQNLDGDFLGETTYDPQCAGCVALAASLFRRAYFVTLEDGAALCGPCALARGIDLADTDVEVWEQGSDGWTGQPGPCVDCDCAIHVIVNGSESEVSEWDE